MKEKFDECAQEDSINLVGMTIQHNDATLQESIEVFFSSYSRNNNGTRNNLVCFIYVPVHCSVIFLHLNFLLVFLSQNHTSQAC